VDATHLQAELAAAYVLGALPPDERRDFEAHLATCAVCAAEVRSFQPVALAIAQSVPLAEPAPRLRAKLMGRIRPRPVLAPWLAAAAALVAAVGLGLYATQLRDRIGSLEGALRQAVARADATDRLLADARQTNARVQTTVALLSAPDLARVDLAGQQGAPRASARAFWSRSRGLLLTASNLPALPAGRTYQLWVLSAQPAPISAGLLKPDAEGRFSEVFNTPADLPQPNGMAISIEPDGGVTAPTGAIVLAGKAD
jgi:anti-sigma-K factor RskA